MTRSKRKRIYLETGRPLPGDFISFHAGTGLYDYPPQMGRELRKRVARVGNDSFAIVIGLNDWLDHVMVLARIGDNHGHTIGWVHVDEVYPCH